MTQGKVVIAGGGVLGSQIAFQAQYCGFDATIWLRSQGSMERCKPKLRKVHGAYIQALETMKQSRCAENFSHGLVDSHDFDLDSLKAKCGQVLADITLETDMAKAVSDADFVIECVSEDLKAKRDFYHELSQVVPDTTIICTNSSSIKPSKLMRSVKLPERFIAMHFANDIYRCNIAEIMPTQLTDEKVKEATIDFARKLRMVPLPLTKEKEGYLLNSMLIPFLMSGFDLYANGIAQPHDIDKAWTIGTGSPLGPFQIFDIVGIKTAYDIVSEYTKIPSFLAPYNFKAQAHILKTMMDEGRMGKMSGKGFYDYDDKGNPID